MKQEVQVVFNDATKDDLWVEVDSETGLVNITDGVLIIATPDEKYLIPFGNVHFVHTPKMGDGK